MKDIKEIICKRCGCNEFTVLQTVEHIREYRILSNGKLSWKYKIIKLDPEEATLHCQACGQTIDYWEIDEERKVKTLE